MRTRQQLSFTHVHTRAPRRLDEVHHSVKARVCNWEPVNFDKAFSGFPKPPGGEEATRRHLSFEERALRRLIPCGADAQIPPEEPDHPTAARQASHRCAHGTSLSTVASPSLSPIWLVQLRDDLPREVVHVLGHALVALHPRALQTRKLRGGSALIAPARLGSQQRRRVCRRAAGQ